MSDKARASSVSASMQPGVGPERTGAAKKRGGRAIAACIIAALIVALCVVISLQSQGPKLDSRLTVDHVSVKTMLEWRSRGETSGNGWTKVNIGETRVAYLCEVQGLPGKKNDKGEYRDAALLAIEKASALNVAQSTTVHSLEASAKEAEGRGSAGVECTIGGVSYRGYVCSHVNQQGAAVCLAVCPEEDFMESDDVLRAVAASVTYTSR